MRIIRTDYSSISFFNKYDFYMPDIKAHCRRIAALRKWEAGNVPLSTPKISLDILCFCCLHEQGVHVKRLIHELGHSSDRTREILRQLEFDGWITVKQDPTDNRSKLAYPTRKTQNLMSEHARILEKLGVDDWESVQEHNASYLIKEGGS